MVLLLPLSNAAGLAGGRIRKLLVLVLLDRHPGCMELQLQYAKSVRLLRQCAQIPPCFVCIPITGTGNGLWLGTTLLAANLTFASCGECK